MANTKKKNASKKKNTPAAAAGAPPSEAGDGDDIPPPPTTEDDHDHDHDEAASNASSTKKRRDRRLSDKQEVDMLEFLRTNICLWDMKDRDYRNAERKHKLWETLAASMGGGVTPAHLKAAFKNLRNWNTKLDKESSKSGSAPRVMTHRDMQVADRMQFMKATVKHRPAPLTNAKGRGADDTRDIIQTLDDDALEPPPKKKTASRPASSASTSADTEGFETMQTVLDRQNEKLENIVSQFRSPPEVVDLDDPQSASRSIKRSYCNYVSSCVMTYNDEEFDDFQSAFTQIHEQFKAARRAKVRRQQTLAEQAGENTRAYTYPGTQPQTTPSQQYQLDIAHWQAQPPPQLQGQSLYSSQTPDYQAQYRTLTARPQLRQPLPVLPTLLPPTTPHQATGEMPTIPNIRRTSTPKRDATPRDVLNLTDYLNRSSSNPAAEDSQDIVLNQLEEQ